MTVKSISICYEDEYTLVTIQSGGGVEAVVTVPIGAQHEDDCYVKVEEAMSRNRVARFALAAIRACVDAEGDL